MGTVIAALMAIKATVTVTAAAAATPATATAAAITTDPSLLVGSCVTSTKW